MVNPLLPNVLTLYAVKTWVYWRIIKGYKVGTLESNRLIMMTLIYTKQINQLSGPQDETSFFARDRLILVLGQKSDLTMCYSQIIWHARLPLKYTCMYLLTGEISAMNFMG